MKVKDKIFYQIATDKNYKVGDKIKIGENFNGQYYKCMQTKFNIDGDAVHKLGFKGAKRGIFKNKKLMIDLSRFLNSYDFIMREFALEEVRKEKFPNCPSRFKCMFLSDDKDVCLFNLKGFIKRGFGSHFQAIKVKCSGEVHYVKDFAMSRDGLSYNEYKEGAIEYWSQNQKSKSATKEILFIGDAEIVEVLEEYKR